MTISQRVYDLCHTSKTVSSKYAQDPTLVPGQIAKDLYGEGVGSHYGRKSLEGPCHSAEDLQRALECGNWGNTRPSDLFLKIYHDVLGTLEVDPMVGVISPPLMGSSGVIPLSIIAPLWDITRHMSNCIARAENEVFLATNYWKASEAATLITKSLRELSKRMGERGQKAVVKIMYDRGNPKQVLDNHQAVAEKDYTGEAIRIPSPMEVPNLDIQVVNYHKPIFGTFHAKFMVVDRKVAIISSNNIQDNDNLEMMTHVEGPIVDSFYDMSLISWNNALKPPLPSYNRPVVNGGCPSFEQQSHAQLLNEDGGLKSNADLKHNRAGVPGVANMQQPSTLANGDHVGSEGQDMRAEGSAREISTTKQNGEDHHLEEHTAKSPHYDLNIAAEITRSQAVLRPHGSKSTMQCVTNHLNATPKQDDVEFDAPECDVGDEMIPLIPHPSHASLPMALVNRKPWGAPNHSCVYTPQNEAFLSAIRNAEKNVFIQTPNLNAEPLLPALLDAVRRKINVVLYVCLGYNDAGELLPFQGGTNEMVANKLYTSLQEEDKAFLQIFNYVAKDQTKPIHNKFKKRSCHIKLMIVDEHIGIQGNGNQDTQSWFHSQEANLMIDSYDICHAWAEGIRRNQNTHIYGRVSTKDGCWYDSEGRQADGAIGVDPGRFSWAKGIVGAVQRVRGEGGF